MSMPSALPYKNRVVYLLETKLQTELPEDLHHDILCALYDFSRKTNDVLVKEKTQWQSAYFKEKNKNTPVKDPVIV